MRDPPDPSDWSDSGQVISLAYHCGLPACLGVVSALDRRLARRTLAARHAAPHASPDSERWGAGCAERHCSGGPGASCQIEWLITRRAVTSDGCRHAEHGHRATPDPPRPVTQQRHRPGGAPSDAACRNKLDRLDIIYFACFSWDFEDGVDVKTWRGEGCPVRSRIKVKYDRSRAKIATDITADTPSLLPF